VFDDIISGVTAAPPRLIVYGQEGIGKSTFAATAPNPIFRPTEDGLKRIDCKRFPVAKTYGGGGHRNAAGFQVPHSHTLGSNKEASGE